MQYPYDIVTFVRKKTLSIEGHFNKKEDESPMKIFGDMSRLKVTLIGEGKSSVYMNINMEEIPGMRSKTSQIESIMLKTETKKTSSEFNSPAFTERFGMGNLKGKTPIDIMLSDEHYKKTLQEQLQFLKKGVDKYPSNKKLIDAIKDACQFSPEILAEKGYTAASSVSGKYPILEIGVRPLVRKKREDGMCPCYEGTIDYYPGDNYPVVVSIRNYFAPFETKENGTYNVLTSKKEQKTAQELSMRLSWNDWVYALSEIEGAREAFRTYNFGAAWKLAEAEGAKNRKSQPQ